MHKNMHPHTYTHKYTRPYIHDCVAGADDIDGVGLLLPLTGRSVTSSSFTARSNDTTATNESDPRAVNDAYASKISKLKLPGGNSDSRYRGTDTGSDNDAETPTLQNSAGSGIGRSSSRGAPPSYVTAGDVAVALSGSSRRFGNHRTHSTLTASQAAVVNTGESASSSSVYDDDDDDFECRLDDGDSTLPSGVFAGVTATSAYAYASAPDNGYAAGTSTNVNAANGTSDAIDVGAPSSSNTVSALPKNNGGVIVDSATMRSVSSQRAPPFTSTSVEAITASPLPISSTIVTPSRLCGTPAGGNRRPTASPTRSIAATASIPNGTGAVFTGTGRWPGNSTYTGTGMWPGYSQGGSATMMAELEEGNRLAAAWDAPQVEVGTWEAPPQVEVGTTSAWDAPTLSDNAMAVSAVEQHQRTSVESSSQSDNTRAPPLPRSSTTGSSSSIPKPGSHLESIAPRATSAWQPPSIYTHSEPRVFTPADSIHKQQLPSPTSAKLGAFSPVDSGNRYRDSSSSHGPTPGAAFVSASSTAADKGYIPDHAPTPGATPSSGIDIVQSPEHNSSIGTHTNTHASGNDSSISSVQSALSSSRLASRPHNHSVRFVVNGSVENEESERATDEDDLAGADAGPAIDSLQPSSVRETAAGRATANSTTAEIDDSLRAAPTTAAAGGPTTTPSAAATAHSTTSATGNDDDEFDNYDDEESFMQKALGSNGGLAASGRPIQPRTAAFGWSDVDA